MRFAVVAVLMLWVVQAPAAVDLDPSALPHCWSIESDYTADAPALAEFGARFGVELVALANYKVDTDGAAGLQINIVECRSAADAGKVLEWFMTAQHATRDRYIRDGGRVYELMSDDRRVRAVAAHSLGIGPERTRTYKVRVEVAPLERGDESRWNEMFNAALAHSRSPDDEDAVLRALDVGTAFDWGTDLKLRMAEPAWGAPDYTFVPLPATTSTAADILTASFGELPREVDIPRVTVEAVVPVKAFGEYEPAEPVDVYELTRSTDPWPVRHREVMKAFQHPGWDPTAGKLAMLQTIHCWLRDNLRYNGETGSRYGVPTTLDQGYGHCWDFSDAFISMCRRVDIPARQVMGWLYGGEGHVWAEAYIDGRGWIAVDPTASWLGVTEDYIPLFYSDQGHAPFVYTNMPEISVVPR